MGAQAYAQAKWPPGCYAVDLPCSLFSTAILFVQVNRLHAGTPLAKFTLRYLYNALGTLRVPAYHPRIRSIMVVMQLVPLFFY